MNKPGALYIVATPIGNLDDLGRRAAQTLAAADLVLAEDSRHSRRLLNRLGVKTPLLSCHEHNEERLVPQVIARLLAGQDVALISDAGTPLVCDPGFRLVQEAHVQGVPVSPVPGPSALVAALSCAGIPPGRFLFEGFPPEKTAARRRCLQGLAAQERTLIFYEAPHRIQAFLRDAADILGGDRQATIARELTKKFETIRRAALAELAAWVEEDANQRRGEFVVVIAGNDGKREEGDAAALTAVLRVLMKSLALKQSVRIAAELSGRSRNEAYALAVRLREAGQGAEAAADAAPGAGTAAEPGADGDAPEEAE